MKEELLKIAKTVINNSYSPYSHFKVAAVIKLENGKTYYGVNIENASYGLTNCAERTCLFKAYSEGIKKEDILAILIYAPKSLEITPCGACRQVMVELMNLDAQVFLTNGDKIIEKTVGFFMPLPFLPEALEK